MFGRKSRRKFLWRTRANTNCSLAESDLAQLGYSNSHSFCCSWDEGSVQVWQRSWRPQIKFRYFTVPWMFPRAPMIIREVKWRVCEIVGSLLSSFLSTCVRNNCHTTVCSCSEMGVVVRRMFVNIDNKDRQGLLCQNKYEGEKVVVLNVCRKVDIIVVTRPRLPFSHTLADKHSQILTLRLTHTHNFFSHFYTNSHPWQFFNKHSVGFSHSNILMKSPSPLSLTHTRKETKIIKANNKVDL